jgi:uncharacterized protein (DUF427 family)
MALGTGSGPFGPTPGGVFNVPIPSDGVIWFEDSPRRVRARFAGQTIVDTRRAKLLHESRHLPVYYLPTADVRMDLLEPSARRTHCPLKGDARYWSVRVGDRLSEDAAWQYPEPIPGAPPIADHLAFYWDAVDEWLEEDEQVFVHARDPYHRVDVLETSRHVRIAFAGERLADTRQARVLFESGLPPRWYVPPADVRRELLVPSDRVTACPYKGTAAYWSVRIGDRVADAIAWTYPDPVRAAAPIRGRICFFDERVDVEIDGEAQERPVSPWSTIDPWSWRPEGAVRRSR